MSLDNEHPAFDWIKVSSPGLAKNARGARSLRGVECIKSLNLDLDLIRTLLQTPGASRYCVDMIDLNLISIIAAPRAVFIDKHYEPPQWIFGEDCIL